MKKNSIMLGKKESDVSAVSSSANAARLNVDVYLGMNNMSGIKKYNTVSMQLYFFLELIINQCVIVIQLVILVS